MENLFVKFIPEKQKLIACHSCGKIGHKSYVCNNRSRTNHGKVDFKVKSCAPSAIKKVTQIWVPRGTIPRNLAVSKKSWIPKLT